MNPPLHSVHLYVLDANRTMGTLPVAEHLRPPRRGVGFDCPLYQRLTTPNAGPAWRWYDLTDLVPVQTALALPIAGEA